MTTNCGDPLEFPQAPPYKKSSNLLSTGLFLHPTQLLVILIPFYHIILASLLSLQLLP